MTYEPEDDAQLTKASNKRLEKLRQQDIFVAVAKGDYGRFPLSLDFGALVYSGKKSEETKAEAIQKIQEIRQIFDEKGDAQYRALYKVLADSSLNHAEQDIERGLYRDALTGVFAAERYFMHSREWTDLKAGARIRPVRGIQPGSA